MTREHHQRYMEAFGAALLMEDYSFSGKDAGWFRLEGAIAAGEAVDRTTSRANWNRYPFWLSSVKSPSDYKAFEDLVKKPKNPYKPGSWQAKSWNGGAKLTYGEFNKRGDEWEPGTKFWIGLQHQSYPPWLEVFGSSHD